MEPQERIDASITYTHSCGQDVSELIRSVEIDGEDHEIECPKCEQAISLRRIE